MTRRSRCARVILTACDLDLDPDLTWFVDTPAASNTNLHKHTTNRRLQFNIQPPPKKKPPTLTLTQRGSQCAPGVGSAPGQHHVQAPCGGAAGPHGGAHAPVGTRRRTVSAVLCRASLRFPVLCCAVLCCAVLCCVALRCVERCCLL